MADAASLDLTTGLTLEAWVYPTVTPSGWRGVVGKDVDRYYLMAGSDTGRPATGGTFTTGGNANTYAPAGLAVNTWTHLAAAFDGTTQRLFVNGVQVASRAQSGALTTSTGPLTIGHNFYGEHFTGLIDEVRIYNRALTVTEIQADMATPVARPAGPRLTITAPAEGASLSGTIVTVSYTTSGDLTAVDHVHLQLDDLPEVMDLSFDGTYALTDVAAGSHVLRGYLVRSDHSKIDGSDAAPVTFSSTIPDTTAPSAPGTLTAAATALQATLSWGAATDNVGVTGYRVERCLGTGCSSFVQIGATTALAFTDAGLAATTTYAYRVRATDAAGLLGAYSNVASATTGAASAGGLVAAYGFEEGTGTVAADSSGNGNAGSLRSGTLWTTNGRFGAALQFNGTSSGVTVADAASLDLTTGLTLEAWVYPTVTPSGWRGVVGKDVDRYYLMAGSSRKTPGHRGDLQ